MLEVAVHHVQIDHGALCKMDIWIVSLDLGA